MNLSSRTFKEKNLENFKEVIKDNKVLLSYLYLIFAIIALELKVLSITMIILIKIFILN